MKVVIHRTASSPVMFPMASFLTLSLSNAYRLGSSAQKESILEGVSLLLEENDSDTEVRTISQSFMEMLEINGGNLKIDIPKNLCDKFKTMVDELYYDHTCRQPNNVQLSINDTLIPLVYSPPSNHCSEYANAGESEEFRRRALTI